MKAELQQIREALSYAKGYAIAYPDEGQEAVLMSIADALAVLDKLEAQPVVTHLNMDPNASDETKQAVGEVIRAAYSYKPPASDTAQAMALRFHEAYERLAPSFGYATREDTKEFDPESPNGKLMIAVCSELAQPTAKDQEPVAWMWQQLMHGYMGGWHSKCETFNPLNNVHTKLDDIKGLTPLYAQPQPPAKALNAENADEIARQLFPMQKGMPSWAAGKHRARQQTAADTIVRLRDNGYLAPAKVDVDEAFRVIEQVLDEHGLGVEGNANRVLHDDLRTRLTNLLNS